jgi:hypothetical protein
VYFCAAPLGDIGGVEAAPGIGSVVVPEPDVGQADPPDGADTVGWDVVDGPVVADAPCAADVLLPGGGTVRSLWQYRHLIASSWISSAQYGHFFTMGLQGRWTCQLTAAGLRGSSLG